MLVGAPATAGFSGAGYLFYGSKKRLVGDVAVTSADAIFLGGRAGEMFGYESTGGDIDGDGDDDLFVASKPLAGGPGTISLFLGGARMNGPIPAATAYSQIPVATVDYFTGAALSSGADLTGDGVDDLVVGLGVYLSPLAQPVTYVVGGSSDAFTRGPSQGPIVSHLSGTGNAVAVGDVNGDRRADLITGAPDWTDGGTVYAFWGPVAPGDLSIDQANASFTGPSASRAGAALATGKLRRKGRAADLAIGAPGGAGRTYVVPGIR